MNVYTNGQHGAEGHRIAAAVSRERTNASIQQEFAGNMVRKAIELQRKFIDGASVPPDGLAGEISHCIDA